MIKKIMALLCAALLAVSVAMAELPEPEMAQTDMILGENADRYARDIILYYLAADGASLTPVRRTILAEPGENIARRLVEELLMPPGSSDLLAVAPGDARILRVEVCGGFVTVNLALDVNGIQDDGDMVRLTSAICSTLTAEEGIECVNVIINSMQGTVEDLPVGVMRASDASVAVNMARYEAESARSDGLTREAALYFPSENGMWMLPEVREFDFEGDDYEAALIRALMVGPSDESLSRSLTATAAEEIPAAGNVYVSENGLRVLDISISGVYRDEMALRGISDWQLAAAFTLTMCSFVPGLDGVRLVADGEPLMRLSIKGGERTFENGIMARGDFDTHIGDISRLYFPADDGRLRVVRRAMSLRRADSAYSLMQQLIAGPSEMDGGVLPCMPEGVQADDLLGVTVRNSTAVVNMSQDFYRLCQILDEDEERALVYSIVNTLCELEYIDDVALLIEGERVETLANSIYLGTSLMANPGIIE